MLVPSSEQRLCPQLSATLKIRDSLTFSCLRPSGSKCTIKIVYGSIQINENIMIEAFFKWVENDTL